MRDERAKLTAQQLRRFSSDIWPEAVRDFGRCGMQLQARDAGGEIGRTAGDRPVFKGFERGAINMVINMVLTDRIPMYWDNGRGWRA